MFDHHQEASKLKGLENRQTSFVPLKDAPEKSFYTERIKIFQNQLLNDALIILYGGLVYLFQIDDKWHKAALVLPPYNFLDDLQKVIYSENHIQYLALKLRDMRKTQGQRDHVIIEVADRELFADFVMDYAEKEEDEVIFEQNREFSMIVNASPVWFSFDDIERCKRKNI